jgi:hypothetical protein
MSLQIYSRTHLPGAIGSGLYRVPSTKQHNWSGEWHLRPRKRLTGPAESFALDRPKPSESRSFERRG